MARKRIKKTDEALENNSNVEIPESKRNKEVEESASELLQKQTQQPQVKKTKETKKQSTPKKQVNGPCHKCWKIFQIIVFIIFLPPFLNYAALQRENQVLKPIGELYDIGWGQKLYMHCSGHGKPTVVLDAPTGSSSDVWILIVKELEKYTTVCVYDRAGLGYSDAPHYNVSLEATQGTPFTVERMVDDLRHLLTSTNPQAQPFILIGSEIGALIARFYAQIYEREVSDVVLIDPLVENLFVQDNGIWKQFWYGHLIPSFQALQFAALSGISRIALLVGLMQQPITGDLIPEEIILRQKYLICQPQHMAAIVEEHLAVNQSFRQLRYFYVNLSDKVKFKEREEEILIFTARTTAWLIKQFPQNISVTVITGNYYDEQLPNALNKAWAKAQEELISKIHSSSKHIVINGADHHMLYRQPQHVVEPIKRLIRQWQQRNYVISKSI